MPFLGKKKTRRAIFSFDSQQPSSSSSSVITTSESTNRNTSEPNTNDQVSNNETETFLLVTNCIRYILHCQCMQIQIKQININAHFKDNFNVDRKEFPRLFQLVKQRLFDDFGLILVESNDTDVKTYILHSIFKNDLLHLDDTPSDQNVPYLLNINIPDRYDDNLPINQDDINVETSFDEILNTSKRALLLISLSLIMLQDSETISEKDLFAHLEEIGLALDFKYDSGHDLPKNTIKNLISKDFVRQGYFKRTKKANVDTSKPADFEYEWGFRSIIEFSKLDVLNFIKHIYQNNDVFLEQIETNIASSEQLRQRLIDYQSSQQNPAESNSNPIEIE